MAFKVLALIVVVALAAPSLHVVWGQEDTSEVMFTSCSDSLGDSGMPLPDEDVEDPVDAVCDSLESSLDNLANYVAQCRECFQLQDDEQKSSCLRCFEVAYDLANTEETSADALPQIGEMLVRCKEAVQPPSAHQDCMCNLAAIHTSMADEDTTGFVPSQWFDKCRHTQCQAQALCIGKAYAELSEDPNSFNKVQACYELECPEEEQEEEEDEEPPVEDADADPDAQA